MRFVDYKCNDCGIADEYVISSGDCNGVICSSCGSSNTVRIFSPISFKSSSSGSESCGCDDSSSCSNPSSKSCSGGSCSTCSGCN